MILLIFQKKERKKRKEIQKHNTINNYKSNFIDKGKIVPEKLGRKVFKEDVSKSLKIAMNSTASMGKFDVKSKGQPKENALHTGNKQKFKSTEYNKNENEESTSILNRILKTQQKKKRNVNQKNQLMYFKNLLKSKKDQ